MKFLPNGKVKLTGIEWQTLQHSHGAVSGFLESMSTGIKDLLEDDYEVYCKATHILAGGSLKTYVSDEEEDEESEEEEEGFKVGDLKVSFHTDLLPELNDDVYERTRKAVQNMLAEEPDAYKPMRELARVEAEDRRKTINNALVYYTPQSATFIRAKITHVDWTTDKACAEYEGNTYNVYFDAENRQRWVLEEESYKILQTIREKAAHERITVFASEDSMVTYDGIVAHLSKEEGKAVIVYEGFFRDCYWFENRWVLAGKDRQHVTNPLQEEAKEPRLKLIALDEASTLEGLIDNLTGKTVKVFLQKDSGVSFNAKVVHAATSADYGTVETNATIEYDGINYYAYLEDSRWILQGESYQRIIFPDRTKNPPAATSWMVRGGYSEPDKPQINWFKDAFSEASLGFLNGLIETTKEPATPSQELTTSTSSQAQTGDEVTVYLHPESGVKFKAVVTLHTLSNKVNVRYRNDIYTATWTGWLWMLDNPSYQRFVYHFPQEEG